MSVNNALVKAKKFIKLASTPLCAALHLPRALRLKAKLQQKPQTKPKLGELLPREFILKYTKDKT